MTKSPRVLPILLALVAGSCIDPTSEQYAGDSGPDLVSFLDAGETCTDPSGDYDGDGLTNAQEGCLSGRDSDGDKIPDWQDLDSDGDKIADNVESGARDSAGKCKAPPGKPWPCDTDGDMLPDYLDKDSDGDGLEDGEEDENGDGLLGCCLTLCNKPGATQAKKCTLTSEGCGSGQKCTSGSCIPSANFLCSEGETSPRKKDTFGDGQLDARRGTFICRDATESKPGRKPVQLRTDKAGDWSLALDTSLKYGLLTLTGVASGTAAAAINKDKIGEEVAGFVISRAATKDVQAELADLVSALTASPPGGGTVTVQASGVQGKSHDRYDLVEGTLLALTGGSSTDASSVRNALMAGLLGITTSQISNLPAPFSSSATEFTIRFSTVRRFAFKTDSGGKLVLDAKGYPTDSGDSTKWRLVVMGAVTATSAYKNPKGMAGITADDLSNGTGLALSSDKVGNECDAASVDKIPMADIVWVSDESGSMNDNRNDAVAHASEFFKRALAMGLDFRMGITNVVPQGAVGYGKFCSQVSTNKSDSGGVDRFLLPTEQAEFVSCIRNPPGYTGGHSPGEYGLINAREALKGHLPRAQNDPSRFRKDASIIYIVLTDQIAAAVESAVTYSGTKLCQLSSTVQSSVDTLLQPYISLFNGSLDPEAVVSKFFVIGGVCKNSCNAMIAHGYNELVKIFGGQIGDVCQKNLSSTMQVFLDSIVAGSSPMKLDYVPISSSLAVTMDGKELTRSRTAGFDYRTNNNSLVFISTNYKKGSQVFASYKRWERQLTIK